MHADRAPVMLSGRCGVSCGGKETGECTRAEFLKDLFAEEIMGAEDFMVILDKMESSKLSDCEQPDILAKTIAKLRGSIV